MAITPQQLDKAARIISSEAQSENPADLLTIFHKVGADESAKQHRYDIVKQPRFQNLLDKYLPDDMLARRHAELIQSENQPVSIKALELGYRVKRKLGNNEARDLNLNINFGNQPMQAMIDGEVIDLYDSSAPDIEVNSEQE